MTPFENQSLARWSKGASQLHSRPFPADPSPSSTAPTQPPAPAVEPALSEAEGAAQDDEVGSAMNRYPTHGSVRMYFGVAGRGSSFRRSEPTWNRTASLVVPGAPFQTAAIRSSTSLAGRRCGPDARGWPARSG